MTRAALIISNGPLPDMSAVNLADFAYVLGVNGRATEYACTHWVIRDPKAFAKWHRHIRLPPPAGPEAESDWPVLVASRNLLNPDLYEGLPGGRSVAEHVVSWPEVIWLDDIAFPNPSYGPKWFQWSGVAALGFAATLDVCRIVAVGADMGGDDGGPTAGHGDRTGKRWESERPVWRHNRIIAALNGKIVDQIAAMAVAGVSP